MRTKRRNAYTLHVGGGIHIFILSTNICTCLCQDWKQDLSSTYAGRYRGQESMWTGLNTKTMSIKEVMLELNLERKEGGSQIGNRGEWVRCVRKAEEWGEKKCQENTTPRAFKAFFHFLTSNMSS